MKKILFSILAIFLFSSFSNLHAQYVGNGTPFLFNYPPTQNPNGLGPHAGSPAPYEGTGYTGSAAMWDGPAQGQTIVAASTGVIIDLTAQVAIRTSTGDIQVKIYDAPNGNLLTTSTNTVNAPWAGSEFNFVMGNWFFPSFTLVSGNSYYLEFTATNGNQFYIGMNNGGAYVPGQHYTGAQGSVSPTTYDIDMILNYGVNVPADLISTFDQGDIDDDGDMDFVRTTFRSDVGGIDFFINDGTNHFNETALNPFGISNHPLPSGLYHLCSDLADLDGDGDLDLTVVAAGGAGFYFFENEGTPASPVFGVLELNPFALEIGTISSIDIVDLDGDGLLDVIGSNDALNSYQLVYYHNIGTITNPEFDVPVTNPFGLDFDVTMGYNNYPDYITFTDWDNDGDLDMLSMPGTAIYYNENVGTASNPLFNPHEYQFAYSAYYGSLEPVNWDGDANKELLMGTESGDIYLFDTPELSITLQPTSTGACDGGYASFHIEGTFISNYEWQYLDPYAGWVSTMEDWYHSGTFSDTYILSFLSANDIGSYRCIVYDPFGVAMISDVVTLSVVPLTTYYADNDGDGFGDFMQNTSTCTGPPVGYVLNSTDCDDTNSSITSPPGDPTVFGLNQWNIYGYQGVDFGAYRGYYVRTGMTYDSQTDYNLMLSPSATPDWTGCSITDDNHSWVAKRHGFPTSSFPYTIQLTSWDDNAYIYVDGQLVYSVGCCGGTSNAWIGNLDANSEVEIRYVEYGGASFIGFDIFETLPLEVFTNNPNQTFEACSQFTLSPEIQSAYGFSAADITWTATVDNSSIVQPGIVNIDTWWGLNISFYGGGTVGTTVLHVTGTDPYGNSSTADFTITTTPCMPMFGDLQSLLECGDTTGTVALYVWNYPDSIPYTVQSIFSSNWGAITDADLAIIATNPSSHINPAGLEFHGTEYVIQYTYTQPDTYSDIYIDLLDTAGTFYEHAAFTSRNIDYSSPSITADFTQITLNADASCTAVAEWNTAQVLPQMYFGTNSNYISNFTSSGIFYVAANAGAGVTSFGLTGNAGADGSGEVYTGSENYVAPSGRAYKLFWETAQEMGGDPGINTILLVDASEASSYLSYDPYESDARAVIESLSGTETALFAATIGSLPYYLNGDLPSFFSQADMLLIGERMADAIDATRTLATGNPFDLSAIDAAMQTETSYLVANVLTSFFALDPISNNDLMYNGDGAIVGIADGGYDMYDGGNYIVTNYNNYYDIGESGIPYTNGVMTPGGPVGLVSNTVAIGDNCALTYTYDHASGSTFPLGTTTVTCTATDNSGNSTQFTFDVVVNGSALDYYVDADHDGHGTGSPVSFCQAPTSGYALMPDDCDDGDPSRYTGATELCNAIDDDCDGVIDNGLPFTNYYVDTDNDTFGAGAAISLCANPGAGYSLNNTDCNNNVAAIHPGAAEVCGNTIDDNCNSQIDEGCTVIVPGDNPSTALSIPIAYWPNCTAINSTLIGATPSQSAQTICISGEDKWYQFVATTEAASIVVSTSQNDVMIELQTAAGALVAQENAVGGLGTEILNVSGLVAGQMYKLGIRNYNSSLGIGSFAACVRMLKRGNCDSGSSAAWPNTLSLCQVYKASWAGSGASYRFTFTGIAGPANGSVYTKTQVGATADQVILSTMTPTLPYSSTYHVLVTNIFNLLDGAGTTEVIEVAAISPCTLFTINEPVTALKAADQCAVGPKFRGSVVYSLPWICGVSNWRWRFTEVNPITYQTVGVPIEVNRGAAANAIQLSTVSQLQNGKTYAVQTAPIFTYTGSNYNWGPTQYMCIIGTAGMIENPEINPNQRIAETNDPNLLVYPNPNDGNFIFNVTGIQTAHAEIRVHDALGRQVYHKSIAVDGTYVNNVNLANLSSGLYMIELVYDGKTITQRMMLEK